MGHQYYYTLLGQNLPAKTMHAHLPTPVDPSSVSTSTITELMALIPHDLRYAWY